MRLLINFEITSKIEQYWTYVYNLNQSRLTGDPRALSPPLTCTARSGEIDAVEGVATRKVGAAS